MKRFLSDDLIILMKRFGTVRRVAVEKPFWELKYFPICDDVGGRSASPLPNPKRFKLGRLL